MREERSKWRVSLLVLSGLLSTAVMQLGCGETTPDYKSWTKEIAAQNQGRSGDVDVCYARGWYSDGECDAFCPAPDGTDCRVPATACTVNGDCGAGKHCDTRDCLSCCPNAQPGSACIAACCGVCREDSEAYVPCTDDGQCNGSAGEVCDLTECLSCCPDASAGAPCIGVCCGKCVPAPDKTCSTDAECNRAGEWCIAGRCVPCDNSGSACDIFCPGGMVEPRNGCQPCVCKPSYAACMSNFECDRSIGEVCDLTECLSCCPDAPPGTACINACCGKCVGAPTEVCRSDADCVQGAEWCLDGKCVPCDNAGLVCDIFCPDGMVAPRNGCQPCICKPSYSPCINDFECDALVGQVCDQSECLSCCPNAVGGMPCIDACCGKCVGAPTDVCQSDADCVQGAEWCLDGKCVPCDNSGLTCKILCPNGMVEPRYGCQPCVCKPSYFPCMNEFDCDASLGGPVCDLSECLSCCPDAPLGTSCIDVCCGKCVAAPTKDCQSDVNCAVGAEWCLAGKCVPCDNSGSACDIVCPAGMVEPRNGCQPCACKPSYVPCLDGSLCGTGTCDTSECLSCCPDAAPGTSCIDICCGRCAH